jgi:small-conductance mechanosensitive channel/CRP-like cAMP-binding protein
MIQGLLSLALGGAEVPAWLESTVALLVAAGLFASRRATRSHPTGRRFGGALVLVASAFAVDSVTPWWPKTWPGGLALKAVALLAFFFGLVRALVVWADLLARRRQAYFSTIFRDLVTLVLYGVVVLVVLRTALGVNLTPLLAGSALVTAVIGLALQESLGNVFTGLSLQLQKPFEPGDWVRFGPHLGRVRGIGWRSTTLVTRSLETLEVPNAVLAREVITNYRGRAIGDELFVGVSYGNPPNFVKEVVLEVLRQVPDVAREPPPQVLVVDYGDFAIRYRIRFWMVDYSRQDGVRDQIMTSLWYAFRRHGIEIPFPIRTVHLHEPQPVEHESDDLVAQRLLALRRVDFLAALPEEELQALLPKIREATFGQGETICREGEPGETFYVVERGRLVVSTCGRDGRDLQVAELGPGDFFGEMSLLTGEPRSATVRARTDARLLVVARDGFERIFRSHPEFAEQISRTVAARQSELRERREQPARDEGLEGRSRRLLARMQAMFGF